jgi:hypothetical protein
MKRVITALAVFSLMIFSSSYGQSKEVNTFSDMENAVGYLVDTNGNKYLIIESGDGAKLVRVNENPKNFFGNDLGISRDEINIKEIK